jgi:DNA (cytosine-5)-methyltransferase 1
VTLLRERVLEPGEEFVLTGSGLYVPPANERPDRRPIAVDLFAGAGGFSCGFHLAGYHVIAALEFDPIAAITYAVNLGTPGMSFHFDTPERAALFEKETAKHLGLDPSSKKTTLSIPGPIAGSGWISSYPCACGPDDWDEDDDRHMCAPHGDGCEHMWVADAKNVTGAEILEAIGLERGDVDVVMGGPPCQGFSMGGKRNVVDPRNSLVFEFVRLVLEIRPKAFVMENVPGILSMTTPEGLPVVDALCRIMEDDGFGPYESLRQALLTSSGAGAALKGQPKTKGQRERAEKRAAKTDEPKALQEALL